MCHVTAVFWWLSSARRQFSGVVRWWYIAQSLSWWQASARRQLEREKRVEHENDDYSPGCLLPAAAGVGDVSGLTMHQVRSRTTLAQQDDDGDDDDDMMTMTTMVTMMMTMVTMMIMMVMMMMMVMTTTMVIYSSCCTLFYQ